LRDLFFITAAVALLLAVVRLVSPDVYEVRDVGELAIMVTTVSLTSCCATWAGFSSWHWLWRLSLLVLIVVVDGAVPLAVFPASVGYIFKYQAFIAMFALSTSLVYRARGWKLRWVAEGVSRARAFAN
jgi:hypothetical protein